MDIIRPAFKKRDQNNAGILMELDYDDLAYEVLDLAKKGIINAPEYYTSKRGELDLKWLANDDNDAENGYIWHANMPLPLWLCREVYDAARKVPMNIVEGLLFSDYAMSADERELFELVCEYGKSAGLLSIAEKLFEGAESGDPRAVKMYLELNGALEAQEEDATKKLMNITFSNLDFNPVPETTIPTEIKTIS